MMVNKMRYIIGLLLTLSVAACSVLSVAYNNAPTAITWIANDWFDFEAPQKSAFSERAEKLMQWHRRNELPDYAKFLQGVYTRAQGTITDADVQWMIGEVQTKYRLTGARLAQEAGELAPLLTADNLKAFDARVAKVNAEFTKDYLTPPTVRVKKKRFERIVENTETWMGKLTDAQLNRLGEAADALPMNYPLVFEERVLRQLAMRAIVQSAADKSASKEQVVARLNVWAKDWETGRSAAYKAYTAQYLTQSYRMFSELSNSATPEQRAYANKKLKETIDEILALAKA